MPCSFISYQTFELLIIVFKGVGNNIKKINKWMLQCSSADLNAEWSVFLHDNILLKAQFSKHNKYFCKTTFPLKKHTNLIKQSSKFINQPDDFLLQSKRVKGSAPNWLNCLYCYFFWLHCTYPPVHQILLLIISLQIKSNEIIRRKLFSAGDGW